MVTQIDVVGAKKVEEATVRFKLKTRVGDAYSPEVVREDIKSLYTLGYFEDIVVQADIFEGGLKVIFVLHEKPSIQKIAIVGNKKLAVDKIKGKIDLVEGAIVPPGSLTKNAEKIRLFYEEEGYYQARVDGREERISPQEVAVTFDIVEGEKFDVGEIRIVGNKYLKEKDIKAKLQTSEVFLWFFGGTLKREELHRDLDRIRAYYLDNGFLDIAVAEPEIQIDQKKGQLRVVISVEEGAQYRIGNLTVTGASLFPESEIRGLIRSQAGGIFSRETVQADVVAVTDRYAERGYLFADVAPVTDMRRDERIVHVSMEITEGRQAFINRIEIVGNVRTRDKVIRREVALIEGDVFNSALLKQQPTESGGGWFLRRREGGDATGHGGRQGGCRRGPEGEAHGCLHHRRRVQFRRRPHRRGEHLPKQSVRLREAGDRGGPDRSERQSLQPGLQRSAFLGQRLPDGDAGVQERNELSKHPGVQHRYHGRGDFGRA